jgi:hypothetical protein
MGNLVLGKKARFINIPAHGFIPMVYQGNTNCRERNNGVSMDWQNWTFSDSRGQYVYSKDQIMQSLANLFFKTVEDSKHFTELFGRDAETEEGIRERFGWFAAMQHPNEGKMTFDSFTEVFTNGMKYAKTFEDYYNAGNPVIATWSDWSKGHGYGVPPQTQKTIKNESDYISALVQCNEEGCIKWFELTFNRP